jgi:SAM-dependent methyltransferase
MITLEADAPAAATVAPAAPCSGLLRRDKTGACGDVSPPLVSVAPDGGVDATHHFESVNCYLCGSADAEHLLFAEDDLTGHPGRFRFVTCRVCGLAYQSPRLLLSEVERYYDDNYVAHRKQRNWGVFTRFVERAMSALDVKKEQLIARYCPLTSATTVLDVGCGSGSFLQHLCQRHGVEATGLDFKDLSSSPFLERITFRHGLFYEVDFDRVRFDVVTMWHFLEHDYDPLRSLRTARDLLRPGGRLIVEVPRLDSRTYRWFGRRWPGLQAPQHTTLLDRAHLFGMVRSAGLEIVDYLPYGAFPAYFYLFTGVAFHLLRGRGLNLRRAMLPYFAGQLLLAPLTVFERRLNLAMQTAICRRAE